MVKIRKTIFIALALVFGMSIYVVEARAAKIKDMDSIKSSIERYIYLLETEPCDENSPQEVIGEIKELSSSDIIKESKQTDKKNFLAMTEYLIRRKEMLENLSNFDTNEHEKTISIDVLDSSIDKKQASIEVGVEKRWHYSFLTDVESAAYDKYTFILVNKGGKWLIKDVKGLAESIGAGDLKNLGDAISFSELNGRITQEKTDLLNQRSLGALMDNTNKNAAVVKGGNSYSRTNAVAYARKYAINPNSSYFDFSSPGYGGDCTNYISQCLFAGGILMHPGKKDDENCWYYSKSNDKSSSWTGAAEFKRYVTGGKSRIKYKNTNWSKVDKGDIIQEVSGGSAYHSMIVTGFVTSGAYNQRTDITVCSHTPNRKDVLVSKYYTDSKVYHSILGNK